MPASANVDEEKLNEAYQAWKLGASLRSLARKYGTSKSTLHREFERLELANEKPPEAPQESKPNLTFNDSQPDEKKNDPGALYSTAYNLIEKLREEGADAGEIAIGLVKTLKIMPYNAGAIVRSYFEQKAMHLVEISHRIESVNADLRRLTQRFNIAFIHSAYKRDKCEHYYTGYFQGVCENWRWKQKPNDPYLAAYMIKEAEVWRVQVSLIPEYCAACPAYKPRQQALNTSSHYVRSA